MSSVRWQGSFGREYTERNTFTPAELDALYRNNYGKTRTEMNRDFIGKLPRDIKILEVGCNVGNQLNHLQLMGFHNLCGIDLQDCAPIIGTVLALPFKDKSFDMVFTAGLLIHISPQDIGQALDEIYRCSKQYIWGFEYRAGVYTEINYRGHGNMLWKADFPALYLERFPSLRLINIRKFKYLDSDNADVMFLLEKQNNIKECDERLV